LLSIFADGLYVQMCSQIGLDTAKVADNIRADLATAGKL
jgi:hypothetical protein